jgi:hypothetical protein
MSVRMGRQLTGRIGRTLRLRGETALRSFIWAQKEARSPGQSLLKSRTESTKGALVHICPFHVTIVVSPWRERGLSVSPAWSNDGRMVDARRHLDGRSSVHRIGSVIRKCAYDTGRMKDKRSKRLRDFVAEVERAERPTKADEAFWKRVSEGYPYQVREPVFCWLWANYDQVQQVRHWRGSNLALMDWEDIAKMMREDGVIGSRGDPPNANSARRVWARVCQDKEERRAREAAKPGN